MLAASRSRQAQFASASSPASLEARAGRKQSLRIGARAACGGGSGSIAATYSPTDARMITTERYRSTRREVCSPRPPTTLARPVCSLRLMQAIAAHAATWWQRHGQASSRTPSSLSQLELRRQPAAALRRWQIEHRSDGRSTSRPQSGWWWSALTAPAACMQPRERAASVWQREPSPAA
jgi:hypothetical protein